MEMSVIQIILVFIWSSITGMGSVLDEFQTHRPLIACSVMGLILGDPVKGIILGGTLELIALGWMNIGAAQSPDSALASTISTILVVMGNQSITKGIAIALPVAAAGQVLTVIVRSITVFFQHAAQRAAENAKFKTIEWLHFSALFIQALRVSLPTTLVAVFVSPTMVKTLLNAIPQVITGGLNVAGGMITVVGYAMVLNMMSVKYLMPFFYLGFILGAYLKLSLLSFGVLGLILAIIYVQLNPKFTKAETVTQSNENVQLELREDELDD
ncbi:PTS mannose/fructose/sorbose transporter subunit IIC [Bombilactobacillus folatiphilus]|uniref:PTS mannose/fructose/sorbose transporter subunit IIC n=1 Tax=Bombilactobacillus folatiphilus TaxID=2923362 RepID=A0ABY4PAW6_9LACO|nr:PTS mannose/fructose/sorbose transporter subunit IIC [Bombilactobacillus folatiphilus]UQS82895.1 PTS mannose/fructose/sorbose transporter subunit IIC [Bombilactobacillus folatiphilus]